MNKRTVLLAIVAAVEIFLIIFIGIKSYESNKLHYEGKESVQDNNIDLQSIFSYSYTTLRCGNAFFCFFADNLKLRKQFIRLFF